MTPASNGGEDRQVPVTPSVFLADPDVTLWHGDVLATLRELPAESVDCVVTSPPYWGLRDYGTGEWEGGDAACDHKRKNARNDPDRDTRHTDGRNPETQGLVGVQDAIQFSEVCGKCGARRIDQQLGLEPTPEQYVERMVEVFREVRRVLAAHGTVWLNLGDSYASAPAGNTSAKRVIGNAVMRQETADALMAGARRNKIVGDLKQKDLVGVPWRVAFALQADGWYLRSDIIWSKPNPMPESVTDRPTKAHEYVFLLSKQPRYFFDQEAVREKAEWARWGDQTNGKHEGSESAASWIGDRPKSELTPARRKPLIPEQTLQGVGTQGIGSETFGHWAGERGRNVRSVWEIPTQPYPMAHFATFPEELARRCIAAGCPEQVCRVCGKARERVVEREGAVKNTDYGSEAYAAATERVRVNSTLNGTPPTTRTAGFTDCGHADYRPGIVLDPFMGSGTVAFVARKLGRHAVGIDLNVEYLALAARRLQQQSLFAQEAV